MRKMKDSGIAWIGEIPEDWNAQKLKYCTDFIQEKYDNTLGELNYIGLENIVSGNGKFVETESQYDKMQSLVFQKDDILFGKLRPYLAKVYHCVETGCCSGEFCVIRVNESHDIRYFWNLLISSGFIDTVNFSTYGTKMPRANADFIKNIYIPIPPLDEQNRLAAFLDDKCAHIDAVIEKTRASIDEYKKLKQAIITRAVTKGLRQGRKMKDSGIEWIGEIPREWKILKKLSYAVNKNISYGIVKLFDPDDENGVSVIRCSDVREGKIETENIRTVTPDVSNEYSRTILEGGEVLINIRGTLGGCAVVPQEMKGYNIAREVAMITPSDRVLNRYLMYYFLSKIFINYEKRHLAGSVYIGLNIEMLAACSIPLPLLPEQQEISAYLDAKTAAIDRLIAKKEQLIAEMQSCKKSLIYEVVTGKREVAI